MLEKQNRQNITKQNMKYLNQEYKAKYKQFLVNSKNMINVKTWIKLNMQYQ